MIAILSRADASVGLIAANTPHIVFDEVRQRSPIDLVSIVEATRDAARERGLTRLALFGTRFTMQGGFYPDVFSRSNIELVPPREQDQAYIHDKYVGELLKNTFLQETRERILGIVRTMKERDQIDGVILAGTELPLLLTEERAFGIPLLDTTRIHVTAAVRHTWDYRVDIKGRLRLGGTLRLSRHQDEDATAEPLSLKLSLHHPAPPCTIDDEPFEARAAARTTATSHYDTKRCARTKPLG